MDRQKIKNIIKKDFSNTRLESLKLPRDFSLGLTKTKKQYTPNLNAVRNKDKSKEYLKELEKKRKNNKVIRKNDKNKSSTNGRFIQSNGIFSQGSGDSQKLNRNSEKRCSFRNSDSVSGMIMPAINRNTWAVNKKSENLILDELINNQENQSDEDDEISFKPLTLTPNSDDTKCKIETMPPKFSMTPVPKPFNREEFYSDERPHYSLLKIPDSFSGKGLTDDPNNKKLMDYPLSGMLEGKIGTLQIRKSGKMQARIGNINYDLIKNHNESKCDEELVIITEDANESHKVVTFGKVKSKFNLVPDFISMLQSLRKS